VSYSLRCQHFTYVYVSKRGRLKQCADYIILALVSHASTILLQTILERIQVKTETEIADEQAEF